MNVILDENIRISDFIFYDISIQPGQPIEISIKNNNK